MTTAALYTCTVNSDYVKTFGGTASSLGPEEHPEPQVIAQGKGFELLLKMSGKTGKLQSKTSTQMTKEELVDAMQANAPIIAKGLSWTKSALSKVKEHRTKTAEAADAEATPMAFTSGGTYNSVDDLVQDTVTALDCGQAEAEELVQKTIDELSKATNEMSLNDLADNYTTGFPARIRARLLRIRLILESTTGTRSATHWTRTTRT